MVQIGITGLGTYFPSKIEEAHDLEERLMIPADVLREKMGIRQRHIAGEETVTHMATQASLAAIQNAQIDPNQIRMVVSHGSQYKDHLVWNAASKIQHNVGATSAYAFEMYALCAGAPIALNMARGMMLGDPSLDCVLLAAGSKENELLNYQNIRSRFMFNFGAGGGAMILQRGVNRNVILGASAITDGSLSETVILTEEAVPDDEDAVIGEVKGRLDVTDPIYMAERLGETSLPNFVKVVEDALAKSNHTLADIDFLGITHMKRSFYLQILQALGLTTDQSVYLEDYGHIQSVDQVVALELGGRTRETKRR